MTPAQAHAIRDWIIGRLDLNLNNSSDLYFPLRAAARRAAAQHHPTDDHDRVAAAVGTAVSEALTHIIDAARLTHGSPTFALLTLLADVLDLTDNTQRLMLGEHFRPGTDDWPTAEQP